MLYPLEIEERKLKSLGVYMCPTSFHLQYSAIYSLRPDLRLPQLGVQPEAEEAPVLTAGARLLLQELLPFLSQKPSGALGQVIGPRDGSRV